MVSFLHFYNCTSRIIQCIKRIRDFCFMGT